MWAGLWNMVPFWIALVYGIDSIGQNKFIPFFINWICFVIFAKRIIRIVSLMLKLAEETNENKA